MIAPKTELASLYFSFPVMKSQIPEHLVNAQRSKNTPMQLLVTTTANCAEVLMLRLSEDCHVSFNHSILPTYGQLMLVNVVLLLKDVVEIPHLDASVDGAGEHGVLSSRYQGLDLNDPLVEKKVN